MTSFGEQRATHFVFVFGESCVSSVHSTRRESANKLVCVNRTAKQTCHSRRRTGNPDDRFEVAVQCLQTIHSINHGFVVHGGLAFLPRADYPHDSQMKSHGKRNCRSPAAPAEQARQRAGTSPTLPVRRT